MQIYCIGNPIVWWISALSVLAYGAVLVVYLLRRRRAVYDINDGN
jgi:dolichyl-phosphate-mannose-protein mannosyltransferase